MVDDGQSPLGITKLNNKTCRNCKMPHDLYRTFCASILGLSSDSWATTPMEAAFKNLLLHDVDAMMYYFDTDIYYNCQPIFHPVDCKDMAKILAHLNLLLVGANACSPHIIDLVGREDGNARLTLGRPRGNMSLI
jgi:hypothetical protein